MTPPRPRVAIDAHTLGRRATENETYARGLLSGLVDRTDVEPMAGLERLLGDAELRARLADAGPAHAAQFSWERCAADTAAAYHLALAS